MVAPFVYIEGCGILFEDLWKRLWYAATGQSAIRLVA
jgi:hypothetical protein